MNIMLVIVIYLPNMNSTKAFYCTDEFNKYKYICDNGDMLEKSIPKPQRMPKNRRIQAEIENGVFSAANSNDFDELRILA